MDSRDKNARKNIGNILRGLGFKDTPESRKLDPWMTKILGRQEPQQEDRNIEPPNSNPSLTPVKNHENANQNDLPFDDLKSNSFKQNADRTLVGNQNKRARNSASYTPPVVLPDINLSSSSPIKNHKNQHFKDRPFDDLNSNSLEQNDDNVIVGNLFKKSKDTTSSSSMRKEMPVHLRNMILEKMGCSDLIFVLEKELKFSDVSRDQGRFYITNKKVANEFLNTEEVDRAKNEFNVKLMICDHDYQPGSGEIEVNDITLIIWVSGKRTQCVLNQNWNPIVDKYNLQKDMVVQLWSFRVQSQLYFALIKLSNPPSGH